MCRRIATLQQQLNDAANEIEEMKAARRRQTDMVSAGELFCISYLLYNFYSLYWCTDNIYMLCQFTVKRLLAVC